MVRVVSTLPVKSLRGCRAGSVLQDGDDQYAVKTSLVAGEADPHTPERSWSCGSSARRTGTSTSGYTRQSWVGTGENHSELPKNNLQLEAAVAVDAAENFEVPVVIRVTRRIKVKLRYRVIKKLNT
jgi:hypothetical protein